MAKILPSPLISQISGSVGSGTFRTSKSGTILYSTPPVKRVETVWAQEARIIQSTAAADWNNLSDDKKAWWTRAATNENALFNTAKVFSKSGRLFYIGWRTRCLHAASTVSYDTTPPYPIYQSVSIRIRLFQGILGFDFYGINWTAVPPHPRSAAWLSWPKNGTEKAGRTWWKIWPQKGYENMVHAVNMESTLFEQRGIFPEFRDMVGGYYTVRQNPKIRQYRVSISGRISIAPDTEIVNPLGVYNLVIPLRPTTYYRY